MLEGLDNFLQLMGHFAKEKNEDFGTIWKELWMDYICHGW